MTQSGHQHAVPPNPDLRTWAWIDCEVNWNAGFESRDVRGIAAEGLSEADHSRTLLSDKSLPSLQSPLLALGLLLHIA